MSARHFAVDNDTARWVTLRAFQMDATEVTLAAHAYEVLVARVPHAWLVGAARGVVSPAVEQGDMDACDTFGATSL
jgi:hypothetical protein